MKKVLPWSRVRSVEWFKKGEPESPSALVFDNGALVEFKSAEARREKFQGAELDLCAVDEEVPGDVVRDTYHLILDDAQPPCACTLKVGMYDPAAGVRLPAYDGLGERFEDDAVVAGGVAVR